MYLPDARPCGRHRRHQRPFRQLCGWETKRWLVELPTADFARDADLIDAALAALPSHAFGACCIAVAGPVFGAEARLTNVDLEFSSHTLVAAVGGGRVALVNDMVCARHGGRRSAEPPLRTVERSASDGTKGVIAAGTGLGMGVVVGVGAYRRKGATPASRRSGRSSVNFWRSPSERPRKPFAWEHYLSGRGMVTLYEAVNAVWGRSRKR